jgi:hypothetical protein
MGKAIGEILPLAIGVAISPVPIIAIVLMLGSPRGAHDRVAPPPSRQAVARKAGEEPTMPNWMQRIDGLSTGKALALGVVLGVNPKNFARTIAAALAIAETGISTGQEAGQWRSSSSAR